MNKRMKLVLVDWIDSHAGRGWQSAEQLERAAEPMRCRSVGWLLKNTKECAVIVPHISGVDSGQMMTGCGDLSIPHAAITRIKTLQI